MGPDLRVQILFDVPAMHHAAIQVECAPGPHYGLCILRKNLIHRREDLPPVAFLLSQLRLSGAGQRVDFGAAAILQFLPSAFDPAFLRQPVQCGKQGTWTDHENVFCDLRDAVRYADAMQRSRLQRAQNEQIQSSLQKFRFCHGVMISTFDIACQHDPADETGSPYVL